MIDCNHIASDFADVAFNAGRPSASSLTTRLPRCASPHRLRLQRLGPRGVPCDTLTMPKRSIKPPRDTNQLAKLGAHFATREAALPKIDEGKDPAAVALGRKGGLKGGKARAEKLSASRRADIAKAAAAARWKAKVKRAEGERVDAQARPKRRIKISTPDD